MKLKNCFEIIKIGNDTIAVDVSSDTVDLRDAVVLNGTAELLFTAMQNQTDEKELVELLCIRYHINEQKAKKDVSAFVQGLNEKGLLEL